MQQPIPPETLDVDDRIRRSQGRLARNANASVKVTKEEHRELTAAARAEGKALSEWSREVLLKEARGGCTQTAIFTELMALRLLLNGVLRPLALGETLSKEKYQALIIEARSSKHETARDVLKQYEPKQTGGQ